ncbi:Ankyrin repeat and protein kinase domain-containing protein 1 [Hondaea fermentalgiana]|uniref:Ankyrin repeat and protein kinase domain-containing protein 1 n=1 Tax=Hondaea fermentalgiana TaxID=2315210 RepID=A0A2R5GLS6_9STRA|nr:Ankyrin repeat and protein kinase domain-containing protein 1 [Hondaea fermentalgiana]|eukprot:GBG31585.1 Ankyrin repeat and protein kinase domain-containing protein 1 [Hondaea fermentalgiana]
MRLLYESVQRGDVEAVVEAVTAKPEKLDKVLTQANDTPLTWALNPNSGMHPEIARVLIERGANVDAQQSDGWTPLMLACRYSQPEIAKMLVERGAKLDLQKCDGWTALMIACSEGETEIATLLVQRGAKLDVQNNQGWTALMFACELAQPKVAQDIIRRGALLDTQQKQGWTALMFAARHDQPETVRMLLERGAKVDIEDQDGVTALMHACRKPTSTAHTCQGLLAAVKACWAAGASLESPSSKANEVAEAETSTTTVEESAIDAGRGPGAEDISDDDDDDVPELIGGSSRRLRAQNSVAEDTPAAVDAPDSDKASEPRDEEVSGTAETVGDEEPLPTAVDVNEPTSTKSSTQSALKIAQEEHRADAVEFLTFVSKSDVTSLLLDELKMPREVVVSFFDNEVRSAEDCAILTEADLQQMGVDTVMKRRKILRHFQPSKAPETQEQETTKAPVTPAETKEKETEPVARAASPDSAKAGFADRLSQAQQQQQQQRPADDPQCCVQ